MSGEGKTSGKRFNRDTSPFHLIFHMDGELLVRQFGALEELARFVKANSLAWADYGIIHGEMVKEIPRPELGDDLIEEELETPESGIEPLSPDDARELVDKDSE